MLDYCAEHRIVADVELIPGQDVNEAYGRMLRRDVRHRFVIDLASLEGDETGGKGGGVTGATAGPARPL
jgi:uncharacterized zinc-type alcohol dehydrogenase-like protein